MKSPDFSKYKFHITKNQNIVISYMFKYIQTIRVEFVIKYNVPTGYIKIYIPNIIQSIIHSPKNFLLILLIIVLYRLTPYKTKGKKWNTAQFPCMYMYIHACLNKRTHLIQSYPIATLTLSTNSIEKVSYEE